MQSKYKYILLKIIVFRSRQMLQRHRASDELRKAAGAAIETDPRGRASVPSQDATAAKETQTPMSTPDIEKTARLIAAFERKSAIAVDHLNRMVNQRAVLALKKIGMDNAEKHAEDIRAKISEYMDRDLDDWRLPPNSEELKQSRPKREAAFRGVCEAAVNINVQRYGAEGAAVVERLGYIAAIRRTAANDMRETLRSVEKTMPAEPETRGGIYWLDQITDPVPIGSIEDEYELPDEKTLGLLRRRRRQVSPPPESEERQRKTRDPATLEEVSSFVQKSEEVVQSYESRRKDGRLRSWSVLDFIITNPCLRKTLKIADHLDTLSKAFGSGEARMTAEGFVPAGFLNRAAQYARGAVQEAEAQGAYAVTSVATKKGVVIAGRVLSGLTTWMNMNTYRALEYEAGLQSLLKQRLLKVQEINQRSAEALNEAGDLTDAWNALVHVADPERPGRMLPIENPSESFVRSIYAACGPKEGIDRVFRIALSSPTGTPLLSGSDPIDTYFKAMSGNGLLLADGKVLGDDVPLSEIALTEEQSVQALEYLVGRVNQLPVSASPYYAMSSIISQKTGRTIRNAQAAVEPLQEEIDKIEDRIAAINADPLVGFMTLLEGYGIQYLSVVFPDVMNFYLTQKFVRPIIPFINSYIVRPTAHFIDSYTGGYIGAGVDQLNRTVCGGGLSAFKNIVGLFTGEGVSWTTVVLTMLSGSGPFAMAYRWWQNFINSGGSVQVAMQYVGNVFSRILKVVVERITQIWEALSFDNIAASMESTGLVRPAAYLIWWVLEDAARIMESVFGANYLGIGKALAGLISRLALRAKVDAFISMLPQAASGLFQAVRVYYGAASALNTLTQVTSILLSGMVAVPLSVPAVPAALATIMAALSISPWLLPYELLEGTRLEFAGNAFLSLRRALAYYMVDPMHDAAMFLVPKQFRKALQATGGVFGNIGNFICMRPEYGTAVLTFLSIMLKYNLGFAVNKALLGNYKDDDDPVLLRTREAERKIEVSAAIQRIIPSSSGMTEKVKGEASEILYRYAATMCSLGEGQMNSRDAYKALEETFF